METMKIRICPKCKGRRSTISCLTSSPPQYEYDCNRCGWCLRYHNRVNSKAEITQAELDDAYAKEQESQ